MNDYRRALDERTEKNQWNGGYNQVIFTGDDVTEYDDFWKDTLDEEAYTLRYDLIEQYSYAIPNDEAIDTLVSHDPLLEVGAGNGYWAHLVEEAGGTITATDINPSDCYDNDDLYRETWTEVVQADHTIVEDYPDRTLFLCWPSLGETWAKEALELYEGDTVIYVGEGRGGCTAEYGFHLLLSQEWGLADEVIEIPQWSGIHDKMYVFTR